MDYSPDGVKFILHELGQINIPHPWLSKIMHLHFISRPILQLDLQPTNHRQCSTKTMSWTNYFSNLILSHQFIYMSKYYLFHSHKIKIETSVNGAVFAFGIWSHLEVEILPPVAFVLRPSNRKYNSLDIRPVPNIPSSQGQIIKYIKRLLYRYLLRHMTVPSLNTLFITECQRHILGNQLGFGKVIYWGLRLGREKGKCITRRYKEDENDK